MTSDDISTDGGHSTLTALFSTSAAADAAMGDLMSSGFDAADVRMSAADEQGTSAAATPGGTVVPAVPAVPPAAEFGIGAVGGLGEPGGGLPYTADSAGAGGYATALGMFHPPAQRAPSDADAARAGQVMVSVRAGARAAVARMILERNGGAVSGKQAD